MRKIDMSSIDDVDVQQVDVCSSCDGEAVLSYEIQEFNYGPETDGVVLQARVPVWTCKSCHDQLMGEEAEELMHDAVCQHLGRLTPREVRSIRSTFSMLQDEFAELTGYGTASIKRWEAGSQIQSESADKHLRLIRSLGATEARKRTRAPAEPKLRMPYDPSKWEMANVFELRRRPTAPAMREAA
jgi:putative zinc finger/helix-turn-helix YgiT family protein